MNLVGSRRGKPLLPLRLQWIVLVVMIFVSTAAVFDWARTATDSHHHEHLRTILISGGLTLMAAAGVVRRNRAWHVALFVAGGACVILAALLRFLAR